MKNKFIIQIKICLLMLFLILTENNLSQTYIAGTVTDKFSNNPLPNVNILVSGSRLGTSTTELGRFKLILEPGIYELIISAVGYKTKLEKLTLNENNRLHLKIELEEQVIGLGQEIIVYDEVDGQSSNLWLNSTDDILQNANSISMMQRANFALEPSIRGLNAGQIGVVIDGMKIFSACIDRMDPVTAYVEVENLQKLEISSNSADLTKSSNIGGTINMVTYKPNFKQPFSLQSEFGFESVSNLKRFRSAVNYSTSTFAARGTFSIKKSNDYYAGENRKVNNSGYSKNNYKFDLSKKFGSNHMLDFSFIGDNAFDIGYPVLLMDATKTESQIYSLEHNWLNVGKILNSLNSKLYFNKIDHWMDDYNRDVTKRTVMKDMYMPMFGNTKTMGLIETLGFVFGKHNFNFILDYYNLKAFADMKMISIFEGVSPSYIVNIGDVVNNSIAAVLDHQIIVDSKLILKTNLRFDYSKRDVENDFGRLELQGFWNDNEIPQEYFTGSASSLFDYWLDDNQSVSLLLALSQRMPTHTENYGFFLYNYIDGYFYTGNPNLKPELSKQIELSYSKREKEYQLKLNLYYNRISNYITGLIQSEEFKIYTNTSSAFITGFELSGMYSFSRLFKMHFGINYTYGHNKELNEPLALIPPLEGRLYLYYGNNNYQVSLDTKLAAKQKRYAYKSSIEDETNSFIILNFNSRVKLFDFCELKFGIQNVFNKLYHEHLSINNLPARGRNIYIGLNFSYD